MAYNQNSHTQQYPPHQHQDPYQHSSQDGSYNDYANGAYAHDEGRFGTSYGGLNSSSGHPPRSPGAYHRVYPNDGFYRGGVQYKPQDSKTGQPVGDVYGGDYGSEQGNGHGIGQAVLGDYQSPAASSYVPDEPRVQDTRRVPTKTAGWDGPFPSFTTTKGKAQNPGSIDEPTANDVTTNGGVPNSIDNVPHDGRPRTAGSKGSQRSTRSRGQHQNGQRNLDSPGQNQGSENSPTHATITGDANYNAQGGQGYHEHGFGGGHHNVAKHQDSGHQYVEQTSWQEPGPTAGYHGPEGRGFLPQGAAAPTVEKQYPTDRPQTAGSETYHDHKREESFGDVLDAYFDSESDNHDVQHNSHVHGQSGREELDVQPLQPSSATQQPIEEDMPNFDAQPSQSSNHKRGMSIENHLPGLGQALPAPHPVHSNSLRQNAARPIEPQQARDYTAQVQRSRSQPDFRRVHADQRTVNANVGGNVFEVAGDVPATPAVPQQYANPAEPQYQGNGYGPPNMPSNGYSQPRGRGGPRFAEGQGPVRSQTWNNGQYYQQRPPGPQQHYPPGPGNRALPEYRQQPPPGSMPQMRPGPRPQMPPGSRQQLPLRQRTNPGAGMPPIGPSASHRSPNENMSNVGAPPARQPSSSARFGNPDALPQHPTPIRPGLMPGSVLRQASPPPPIRQYNNTGVLANQDPPPNSAAQADNLGERRNSVPITYDELERLKRFVDANPSDQAAQLLLAKKWVEAAAVLVDDGGGADPKSRNRAREKFIFDAHRLIKKLVNANYAEAMFYLADCYGRGLLGLEPDQKEAFNLYQSAAKLGHASSAYRTAVCCEMGHEDGGGTKKDPLKAIQWYKRAATLGDTPAMYKMGIILLKGLLGQPKNPREAIVWLKRAVERADEENPHALHELGLLYENAGSNDSIIRDENYASQLFTQAAELGYKFSQFRIGCAFEYGSLGYPIDHRQSIIWYSRAAVQGEHQSELALSGWYLTGSEGILQQSDTEAYLWARKAAQAGLAKAEYALGYFTEVGIGTPASLEDAKRWYWRAAAQNFPKARERLEELKSGGSKVQKSRERHSRSNMTKQNEGDCVVM
ncbi:hypothetical protein FGG08_005195 [Glutinoglossum americanum]|uniref:Chitin synthase regulatory factor 3 n=1 Tax=Glutinoglossum americanum TaxID=1670608 RepID=A0A9P8HYZ4_9PEZI|nr:hypothetical protein FGG08_005195 [Glutinoglossum americanum]